MGSDGSSGRGRVEEVLEHVGSIARRLSEAETLQETLQRVVDLGHELLPQCDGISLMLIGKGGRIETPAYSSHVSRDGDRAQYETGQGPCLDAIRDRHTVVIDDLETDERWPAYRKRVLELGVRSMLSLRLFVTSDAMGALDMYSSRVKAFDRESELVGGVYAAQASVAVRSALSVAGLQTALQSRDVIGQAKGIVMVRRRTTADMAIETLKRLSQDRNQPLRDLAREIVESGEIPSR